MLVQAVGVAKSIPAKQLFQDLSFVINPGDRFGLIGGNGCGKTTLIRMITGVEIPNAGSIVRKKGLTVNYMPQDISIDFANASLEKIRLVIYGEIIPGIHYVEVMSGLGLWELVATTDSAELLSGGQRRKLALAVTLIFDADLTIMDEPTNYLDLPSITWLEGFVSRCDLTLLVVSHDRYFLDSVVDGILNLTPSGVKYYPGGYSDFVEVREREDSRQRDLFVAQEKTRRRLKEDIATTKDQAKRTELGTTNDHLRRLAKKVAAKAKARETRLTKLLLSEDQVGKPSERPKIAVDFPANIKRGQTVVRMDHIAFNYPDSGQAIITDATLAIGAGEKIALLGENGSGKSTLLRLVVGIVEPDSGKIWRNESATTGYFSQGLEDIEPKHTVLQAVRSGIPSAVTEEEIRKTLAGLLINESKITQTIESLSLGELTRIGIAQQILKHPDFLVADEFTVNLDIDSIIQIQEALTDYKGALLLVSHDRCLLDSLDVGWYYVLENGVLRRVYGGLEEYELAVSSTGKGG